MALQVWLPLNGDIHNQGLDDNVITSSNITYSIGKLGNAATFAQSYILIKNTPLTGNISAFSFSFWIKLNDITATHCIYNGRSTVGGAIAIFIIGSQLRFDDGLQHNNLYTFKSNIWTHCCITRDSKNIKVYINGFLVNTITSVNFNISITYATIGVSSVNSSEITTNFLQGQLNDFRIYDEALSPKQVKLLSQGLVCHYPMGNIDGKIGGRNLILNGNFTNRTSNWTAEGVANWSVINDETLNKQALSFKTSSRIYNLVTDVWKANTKYTVSFYAKSSIDGAKIQPSRSLANLGDNLSLTTEWKKYTTIISCTETVSGGTLSLSVNNSSATYYITDIKLEKGSSATPWTPAPEDYPAMYDNVIYDSSGYGNNGNVSDSTCPTWSDNSPRYKGCYHFEKKHYLTIQSPFGTNSVSEFTINLWIKQTTTTGGIPTFLSSGGYGGRGLWLAMNAEGNGQWGYKGDVSPNYARGDSTLSLNTWYMFTYVFKDGKVTWYRDGISKKTTTYTSSTSPFANTITLGDNYTGTSWDTSFVGDISDLRIYSTALSDSNILDLYQTSGTIDSNGNLLINEVIEE